MQESNYISKLCLQDWDGQSFSTVMSEICGFIVVLSGTIMLHLTKDFQRSHSFRGMLKFNHILLNLAATDWPTILYILSYYKYVEIAGGGMPSSPTLSVRLYTGNGDSLLKEDEENESPENISSRRQDLC